MAVSVKISKRLQDVIDRLPLKAGMKVLEIGCGTGVAAIEISKLIGNGNVVAIDRSAKTIAQSIRNSKEDLETGNLEFIQDKIEAFCPAKFENYFDIVFAIRVGALDGRHPEIEYQAKANIKKMMKKNGRFFIQGDPITEIKL